MNRIRRIAFSIGGVVVLSIISLIVVVIARTATLASHQIEVMEVTLSHPPVQEIAERLAGSLRIPTVSQEGDAGFDLEAFLRLHTYLEDAFPMAHSVMNREIVSDCSLLYQWEGTDASLDPIVLLAHLDVVPAEHEEDWTHPPFSGRIADGFVWGRGALDVKVGVTGLLEAVEFLLQNGFVPKRTIYLAFGQDEEVGGQRGGRVIAELLRSRGIRAEYLLDEGLVVTDGILPGVTRPVALVGIAEKGILSVELVSHGQPGHSSRPPTRTAVGALSHVVARLEEETMEHRMDAPTRDMFAWIAPEMTGPLKAVFGNLWLFRGLVLNQLAAQPATNATVQTTTAPTMLRGSSRANVLSAEASAVVNFRILPDDSIASVMAHVARIVDDPNIEIRVYENTPPSEPAPVSSTESAGFRAIHQSITEVFPQAVVAPSLVVGATDSRHYVDVARDIYRFLPVVLTPQEVARVHGVDERLSLENYERVVAFYIQLMKRSAK